jgi:hypothetical protein
VATAATGRVLRHEFNTQPTDIPEWWIDRLAAALRASNARPDAARSERRISSSARRHTRNPPMYRSPPVCTFEASR